MKRVSPVPSVMIFVLLALYLTMQSTGQLHAQKTSETSSPAAIYYDILNIHYRWKNQFYGAGMAYKRRMVNLLQKNLGKAVITDKNFLLKKKSYYVNSHYYAVFSFDNWLEIRVKSGEIVLAQMLAAQGSEDKLFGTLIKIEGLLTDYSVSDDQGVILYLEQIKINYLKDEN